MSDLDAAMGRAGEALTQHRRAEALAKEREEQLGVALRRVELAKRDFLHRMAKLGNPGAVWRHYVHTQDYGAIGSLVVIVLGFWRWLKVWELSGAWPISGVDANGFWWTCNGRAFRKEMLHFLSGDPEQNAQRVIDALAVEILKHGGEGLAMSDNGPAPTVDRPHNAIARRTLGTPSRSEALIDVADAAFQEEQRGEIMDALVEDVVARGFTCIVEFTETRVASDRLLVLRARVIANDGSAADHEFKITLNPERTRWERKTVRAIKVESEPDTNVCVRCSRAERDGDLWCAQCRDHLIVLRNSPPSPSVAELFQLYVRLFGERSEDLMDRIFHPDYKAHSSLKPYPSDLRFEKRAIAAVPATTKVWAENTQVVEDGRRVWFGAEIFVETPATSVKSNRVLDIRLESGRIVEEWVYSGVLPSRECL